MRVDVNDWRQNRNQANKPTRDPASIALSGNAPQMTTDDPSGSQTSPDSFRDAMIALIPTLRIQAATRVRSRSEADDLVQETLTRAWCYRGSFQEGSNLKAWLCKIMQNCFYHDLSRQRDTVADVEGRWAAMLSVAPSQEWRLQYNDMLSALDHLPPDARAALVLIGASGVVSATVGAACRFSLQFSGTPAMRYAQYAPRLGIFEALTHRSILIFILMWALSNLLVVYGAGVPADAAGYNIAWQAHVGGFLFGYLLFDLFDRPPHINPEPDQRA